MGYKYRGTIRDLDAPPLTIAHAPKPLVGCGEATGTTAGYKRHQNAREEACDACKAAVAKYAQDYRAKTRTGERYVPKGFSPERCGSYAGYVHHLRHHVPTCAPCKKAQREYMAEYRANRRKHAA